MKVLKFGGTSVGTADRIKHVARLIQSDSQNIVVLSAMAGTTNTLVEIADYLSKGNTPGAQETLNHLNLKYNNVIDALFDPPGAHSRAKAVIGERFSYIRALVRGEYSLAVNKEILAQGELMSTAMMDIYLNEQGVKSVLLPALDYMRTDVNGEPDMKYVSTRLKRLLDLNRDAEVFITQGYICLNAVGEVDNLKRGGSDYSASIIGAVVDADEIEIWTDIDGMHNNDPRYVENTSPVGELNFEEAAELAYFGAKILHPNCVLPAKLANIPVRLLNTLDPKARGTVIYNMPPDGKIKAVAAKDNVTAIKIKSGRMLLAYGFLHKVFETFEKHQTSIDMMATSEVGVTVTIDDESHLAALVDDLKNFGTVTVDRDMVIVCVVGDLEWHNCGFEAQAVAALKDIPVRMISYGGSNYNISIVIRSCDKIEALKRLSSALF
ncbi:MAG: aspartate kinase [Muribaculaceae bacterium]|nr:aspartate kinase [Muribaculaceae bacterium]